MRMEDVKVMAQFPLNVTSPPPAKAFRKVWSVQSPTTPPARNHCPLIRTSAQIPMANDASFFTIKFFPMRNVLSRPRNILWRHRKTLRIAFCGFRFGRVPLFPRLFQPLVIFVLNFFLGLPDAGHLVLLGDGSRGC